ncbi:rodlin [Streptomyces reniochalinae]|uniref:RdlA protein n=1 Tax=Streptomyces reniochalinae TaxID=2250578 RepID=A0A367EUC4_9ACTN|nr:rodlin [Streptomyces reniochalinae]RCG21621.1 RdlA protein [Streptomyces reniochalinae]
MKRMWATVTATASLVGVSAAAAPQALAIGDDRGTTTVNGNGADQTYGNAATHGNGSPQFDLVQGSLNKLCVGLPADVNAGSVVGIIANVAVQDVNVLSNPQNQQCADNSSQDKGDEPLSHLLSDVPVLAGNGAGNG